MKQLLLATATCLLLIAVVLVSGCTSDSTEKTAKEWVKLSVLDTDISVNEEYVFIKVTVENLKTDKIDIHNDMFSIETKDGKKCNGLSDTELADDFDKSPGTLNGGEKATFWTDFKVAKGQTAKKITLQATFDGDNDVTVSVPSR